MLYVCLGHCLLVVLFIVKHIVELPISVFCRSASELTEANTITLASYTDEIP